MSRKSRQLKREGFNVINLSLGEPDFDTPKFIREAAKNALDEGFTHYTPVAGFLELREAITLKLKRDNGLDYQPEQIVASNGAKQSLSNLIYSLVDPGDEVIIPTPYWVTYKDLVYLAQGESVLVHGQQQHEFKITPAQLAAAITPKSKVFMFSSPCNPTGSVYSREELRGLVDVLKAYPNIYTISDEIYEHINFVSKHESIAQFPEIKDRVIVVNGMSKGFAMTGWRLGYIAGPIEIATACNNLQGQLTSAPCSITQRAAIEGLRTNPDDIEELASMKQAFLERRNLLMSLISDIPGLITNVPDGAFYIFPNVRHYYGLSDGVTRIENSEDLSMYLLNKVHVAVVPGSAFGCDNCIRISYATSTSLIEEAVVRIRRALSELH